MAALRRLLLSLAAGLAGCEGAPANVLDTPPGATLRMCPTLPAAMDFGRVPVGGEASRELGGLTDPNVGLALTGAEFTLNRAGPAPMLTVRPTQPGRHEATLQLTASGCPAQVMSLSAEGVAPCVEVAPALQLSPAERSCGTSAGTVSVVNRCATPITVQRARVQEPADGTDAWCAGGPPCDEWGVISRPDVLAPGASGEVKVRFAPANAGPASATLRLTVQQDDGAMELTSALEGTGLPRQTVTDVFPAYPPARVDMLIMLDTSPSMRERGAAVQANLAGFWRYLRSTEYDLQVTLATAERSTAGVVVGTVAGTGSALETQLQQLTATVPAGTEDTSCLEPVLAVLDGPPGVRRPGVPLVVICITDSPDRTPGPWLPMVGRLNSALGPSPFHVVGPFVWPTGVACVPEPDDGRLELLVQSTYGSRDTICAADWSKTLESIGRNSFGVVYWARLAKPALRIVEVSTDGVPLPARDARGATNWTWDTAANTVVLWPLNSFFQREAMVSYEPECR